MKSKIFYNVLKKVYHTYLDISHPFKYGFSLWNTLKLNFSLLPLSQAWRLPIYCYGKCKSLSLRGRIILNTPIQSGLIKIGYASDAFSWDTRVLINIKGNWIVNGPFSASRGVTLEVVGTLETDEGVGLGARVKIRCWNSIKLGKYVRLAEECQLFDTNFHFIQDVLTREVSTIYGTINIGDYSWIGNRTSIMKGTVLPRRTIVASNSLVSKDYSAISVEYPLLGGTPAKFISSGKARIFNLDLEYKLFNIFYSNKELIKYHLQPDENDFL